MPTWSRADTPPGRNPPVELLNALRDSFPESSDLWKVVNRETLRPLPTTRHRFESEQYNEITHELKAIEYRLRHRISRSEFHWLQKISSMLARLHKTSNNAAEPKGRSPSRPPQSQPRPRSPPRSESASGHDQRSQKPQSEPTDTQRDPSKEESPKKIPQFPSETSPSSSERKDEAQLAAQCPQLWAENVQKLSPIPDLLKKLADASPPEHHRCCKLLVGDKKLYRLLSLLLHPDKSQDILNKFESSKGCDAKHVAQVTTDSFKTLAGCNEILSAAHWDCSAPPKSSARHEVPRGNRRPRPAPSPNSARSGQNAREAAGDSERGHSSSRRPTQGTPPDFASAKGNTKGGSYRTEPPSASGGNARDRCITSWLKGVEKSLSRPGLMSKLLSEPLNQASCCEIGKGPKQLLSMSLIIHPDKLKSAFDLYGAPAECKTTYFEEAEKVANKAQLNLNACRDILLDASLDCSGQPNQNQRKRAEEGTDEAEHPTTTNHSEERSAQENTHHNFKPKNQATETDEQRNTKKGNEQRGRPPGSTDSDNSSQHMSDGHQRTSSGSTDQSFLNQQRMTQNERHSLPQNKRERETAINESSDYAYDKEGDSYMTGTLYPEYKRRKAPSLFYYDKFGDAVIK